MKREMKRMFVSSVSAVLLLVVVVQAETIFETFDSDPAAGGWITVGTGGSAFTWLDDLTANEDGDAYHGGGYLETRVVRAGADFDRFSTALSQAYDQSQEFWWEFDTQTVNHQYRYQRALFGVFNSASPNNANIIANNYFRQQSNSGSSMKTHRLTTYDSTGTTKYLNSVYVMNPREPYRVKMHYTYQGGVGTIAVEFWALNKTGDWDDVLVGSDSAELLTAGQKVTFDQFGFGNYQSTANSQIQSSWVDNVYFSTDGPNTDYKEAAFLIEGISPALASEPSPPDRATYVPRDAVLNWTPGVSADKHDVYFGTDFSDVNSANASDLTGIYRGQHDVNSYAPSEVLALETTYYWRVDEVDGPPDYTVYRGSVWSFTTEPVGYPVENVTATASSSDAGKGPENTVNGSGLDDSGLLHGNMGVDTMWLSSVAGPQPTWIEFELDKVYRLHEMWVWNSNDSLESVVGFGLRDVTIEYSVDGANYATLGATHEFARAPGEEDYAHDTTVDLTGVTARHIRLTANSNWEAFRDQYGLSEVRFFYVPLSAREPSPDPGATDVDVDVILGWRAGREAASHDVYLNADPNALTLAGPVTEPAFDTASLDLILGQTYHWRVDEVNDTELPDTWQGDLWSFTTQEYLVVDDFESYNDIDPPDPASNTIFASWEDGYLTPATNGALIGNESTPYIETRAAYVNRGAQALPYFYGAGGKSSVGTLMLTGTACDFTRHGAGQLSLWFRGESTNAVEPMYVALNGIVIAHTNPNATQVDAYEEWIIPLQDFAALGVTLDNVTSIAISIGTPGGASGAGTMYFDNIHLYRIAP